ncbi:MAG: hypothetical protein C5B58_14060 [Acidobacteria bacterium]|nr:MAG: hypothetical protein C5B58_14060 [Acidobacteriota bacterium]
MKIIYLTSLAVMLATWGLASDPGQKQAKTEKVKIESANTICPVTGDQVGGDMGKPVYVEYQGKEIGLCCKDCVKDFKKNPAKFAALAEKNQADEGDK